MTVSKVEKPNKKAPQATLSPDILARQIEALKNDVTPEKLKTIEPELERLKEELRKEANSRRADILRKVKDRLEAIRNELKIKNFLERFSMSEAIILKLKNLPKRERQAKLASLKPSDFPEYPELQKPDVWKNILGDIQGGLAVSELAEEASTHKDPKKYLEKEGGKAGKSILDTIKEHPIIFGACLLAGGVAIYKFFKKNSDTGDKLVGLAAGGVSTLLGISLLKDHLGDSIIDFLGGKLLGDKWEKVKNFFGGDKEKKAKEKAPDGIERMPLSEALGNYWADAQHALLPLADFAAQNADSLKILAVAGFTTSGTFRKAMYHGTKLSLKTAKSLALLLPKFIYHHPLTSLFTTSAVLLSWESVKEVEIPKDTENLFKFLKVEMRKGGNALEGLDVSRISDAHLRIIAEILTGKKSVLDLIPPADQMIGGAVDQGIETLHLTQEKLIREQNTLGLEAFRKKLLYLDNVSPSKETKLAVAILERLTLKLKSKQAVLTKDEIEELSAAVKLLDVEIVSENGRVKAVFKDREGIVHHRSICIDPALSSAKQFDIAQTFFVESENPFEAAGKAAGKLLDIPWQQLRLALGRLGEDVESETEASKVVERKLKEGWILTVAGGTVSLVAEGGAKYILGPAEMIWKLLPGGKEYSCVELAIDYAEGLLPVLAFGIASALVRRDWAAIFKGKVLGRTLAYPYHGTKSALKYLARPLAPRDFNPKALYNNPKMRISSAVEQFKIKWKLRTPMPNDVRAVYRNIRDLQHVKNLMAQANHTFGNTREKLMAKVDGILDEIGFKESVMKGKGVHGIGENHKTLEAAIRRVDRATRQQKIALRKIELARSKITPTKAPTVNPKPPQTATTAPKAPTGGKTKVVDLDTYRENKTVKTAGKTPKTTAEVTLPRLKNLRPGRGFLSRLRAIRSVRMPRLGRLSGALGILSFGAGALAEIIEAKHAHANEKSAISVEKFEKNNPIIDTRMSIDLADAIAGKIKFNKVVKGQMTIERKNGTQIMFFENGWHSRTLIRDKTGEEIADLKIPDGLRTPIEEIVHNVKQTAPLDLIDCDLSDPEFLEQIKSQGYSISKFEKYISRIKIDAKKRNLKIKISRHNKTEIIFVDKQEAIKKRISVKKLVDNFLQLEYAT
ncbi:MAG: hypothetical protein K9L85_02295 [Candidatus Peribacteraceae bacterium]|nr:hypothetical protein [Candidatus Peribacteraceae bacterium]